MYSWICRHNPVSVLALKFQAGQVAFNPASGYNSTPNQQIVIINQCEIMQIIQCAWGFISSWTKEPVIGYTMIMPGPGL